MNLMLEFAKLHDIVPWVETGRLNLEGIQDGIDRLRKGLTRYRYSLIMKCIDISFVAIADE